MEFKGKIYSTNQGATPVVNSQTVQPFGLNQRADIFLTDCDIYSDCTGSAMLITDTGFAATRSRIIGKNLSVIAAAASASIQGDVAGCLYQCKGIWSNKAVGGNASNELTPLQDVLVNALMR